MELPFFFIEDYNKDQREIVLNEETSRHVIQVLRMKIGEQLNLTDGKGNVITASISDDHKKHCTVTVENTTYTQPPARKVSIAISLLKNAARFEWFLEKASEIGVTEIIPLVCKRTEKEKFRHDRMKGICISAILQSQQCWLPVLHEPVAYELLFRQEEVITRSQKFIAHCVDDAKRSLTDMVNKNLHSQIILIGPEGDFTPEEINSAMENHFIPVTLGETRLRTETAGIVAATLLAI